MNEVEKMMQKANIKTCKRKQGFTLKDCTDRDCKECSYYDMPPFTAEKQLELIKWITENEEECRFGYKKEYKYKWWTQTDLQNCFCYENFEESLAGLVNTLWQDLTEEERKQIKGILE